MNERKPLVEVRPPFTASFGFMNERRQIMMSGFVEGTGLSELTPAVAGLAERCVTRSFCYLFCFS